MNSAPIRAAMIGSIAAAAVVLTSAPASACCAPVEAKIEGLGITAPIVVRQAPGKQPWASGDPLRLLAERTGFWNPFEPGAGLGDRRPAGELGDRYTVTFFGGVPGQPSEGRVAIVDIYPYATGGPWTYLREGSAWWQVSGWFSADPALATLLRTLGVPLRELPALNVQPNMDEDVTKLGGDERDGLPRTLALTAAVLVLVLGVTYLRITRSA